MSLSQDGHLERISKPGVAGDGTSEMRLYPTDIPLLGYVFDCPKHLNWRFCNALLTVGCSGMFSPFCAAVILPGRRGHCSTAKCKVGDTELPTKRTTHTAGRNAQDSERITHFGCATPVAPAA